MTGPELSEFIKQVHRHMTVKEIADYLECSENVVRNAAKSGKYDIVTVGERSQEYIRRHMHLSVNELLDKLDISLPSLNLYLTEMGLTAPKAKFRDTPLNQLNGDVLPNDPTIPQVNTGPSSVYQKVFLKYHNTVTWEQLATVPKPTWNNF